MTRAGGILILVATGSFVTTLSVGQSFTPFDGPDQVICTNCPFPLVADLNSDGIMDLIFADPSDPTISWMEGAGDGTFQPASTIGANVLALQYELVGDADDDGDLDLVGANPNSGIVAVQRWMGASFAMELLDTVPPFTTALRQLDQFVDLDGDGFLDILGLFYQDPQDNRWYRARGDGTYEPKDFPGWCSSYSGDFEALDVDGDGDQDLVACSYGQLRLYVQWNLGRGPEGPFTVASTPLQPGPPGARMLNAADLNGDASMDLVVGGRAAYASGTGIFEPELQTANSRFQSVAQINCSYQQEAVMSDTWNFGVLVNSFSGLNTWTVQNIGSQLRTKATDIDGDGLADLILGPNGGQGVVAWRRNPYGEQVTSLDLDSLGFGTDTIPGDTVFLLTGGHPTAGGGFYSGQGVFNDSLYSGLAGPGWVT
ncbi:MAG: VCBS repeat-containing protein, partial [Flavobacteriales bacterium]|nr:VCBS repeat-containing protein [Flavobacteriales bacterium]